MLCKQKHMHSVSNRNYRTGTDKTNREDCYERSAVDWETKFIRSVLVAVDSTPVQHCRGVRGNEDDLSTRYGPSQSVTADRQSA